MDNSQLTPNNTKINHPLPNLDALNGLNNASNLCLNDLGKIVLFKYGSFAELGRKLHISRQRVYQIFRGIDLPTKPESIKKIALALGVDSIILAQVFSNQDNNNSFCPQKPQLEEKPSTNSLGAEPIKLGEKKE